MPVTGALPGAYLGSLAQQRLDERPADALRPAGDQRHLAIDVHGAAGPSLPAGAQEASPAPPEEPSAVSPAPSFLPPSLPPSCPPPSPPPRSSPPPPGGAAAAHSPPLPSRTAPSRPGPGGVGAEQLGPC